MGLFNSRRSAPADGPHVAAGSPLPLLPIDLSKRYDVYYTVYAAGGGEERVYPNVRFLAARTFERINAYTSGLIGGFLEVEAIDGARFLISFHGITQVCEHGTQPGFRVVQRWGNS